MWFFGTPFERHVKSLNTSELNIRKILSRILKMEEEELKVMLQEANTPRDVARICEEISNSIITKRQMAHRLTNFTTSGSESAPTTQHLTDEETRLLEDIIKYNGVINELTQRQLHLLKQSHEFTKKIIVINTHYLEILKNPNLFRNPQLRQYVNDILNFIKKLTIQKSRVIDEIEETREKISKSSDNIIANCKKLEVDDEHLSRIEAEIMEKNRKQQKLMASIGRT